MALLAVLGIRYPLQMLPLLFWEFDLEDHLAASGCASLWRSHQMDEGTAGNVFACSLAVIVAVAIPWRYVFDHYVKKAGDSWRQPASPVAVIQDRSVASDSYSRF